MPTTDAVPITQHSCYRCRQQQGNSAIISYPRVARDYKAGDPPMFSKLTTHLHCPYHAVPVTLHHLVWYKTDSQRAYIGFPKRVYTVHCFS